MFSESSPLLVVEGATAKQTLQATLLEGRILGVPFSVSYANTRGFRPAGVKLISGVRGTGASKYNRIGSSIKMLEGGGGESHTRRRNEPSLRQGEDP